MSGWVRIRARWISGRPRFRDLYRDKIYDSTIIWYLYSSSLVTKCYNFIMKTISTLKRRLLGNRIDPDQLDAYRSAIPENVQLRFTQNGDTVMAIVTGIDNKPVPKSVFLITEAEDNDKLVDQINDLIFTYKGIPEEYRPFYRQALTPEGSIAQAESLSLVKS